MTYNQIRTHKLCTAESATHRLRSVKCPGRYWLTAENNGAGSLVLEKGSRHLSRDWSVEES